MSRDYPERLAELESELSAHPARPVGTPSSALPSLSQVKAGRIGNEVVTRFVHRGKAFAAGHTDVAFPGTNGTRGVRRIHLYDATDKIVLGAAGEFDNHQFGANFRLPKLKTYHAGAWETSFGTMTNGLRTFRADRKEELRQIRARATTVGRRAHP